jgi:hypothetical protein
MQRNRSGMGTGLGDLGRSVAVAMGMGGDSRMGMGMDDVEMVSPVWMNCLKMRNGDT